MSMRQKDREKPPEPSAASMSMGAPGIATLTCTRGPEEGLTLQLMEGSYTIGRARENSFVLKDIAASRRHVRIDVDKRGARMTDLGSGNGTRLNGRRVSEAEMRHGDRIEIGGSVLVYADAGRSAPKDESVADEAQDRVIRAAEKLAAELSERMRFGEGGQGAFEDGHIARTRQLPVADKQQIHEELKRQADQQKQSGKKLWNETLSNLPLNEIIPADDPLRGPRQTAQVASHVPFAPPARVQQAPPRALPISPAEDFEPSFSASHGSGSGFLLPLLVSAFVVILGGAAVLGVWWFTQRGNPAAARGDPAESADREYDKAMDGAERSMLQEEWAQVLEYATLALQHRRGDAAATRYQAKAREKLAALIAAQTQQPPLTPPQPQGAPPQPLPTQPPVAAPAGAQPAAQPTAAQPVAATPPVQPTAQPTTAPPTPQPAAATPPAQPAPPKASPKPREAQAPRESAPRPKPAPTPAPAPVKKPAKGKKMSEDQAKVAFEEAVDLLRNKELDEGCALLERVARDAPGDTPWRDKAESLLERRCD
jgi:Inner membrane component of T3SS, cytoplasmic domain